MTGQANATTAAGQTGAEPRATDAEVFAAFPAVLIDHDNLEHYRGLLARRLLINRCADCGFWIYPHRPLCPRCWSWDVVPTAVSGDGFVFLVTLIHQERDPDALPGQPVPTAAVELVEQPGLRYLARVVNCPPDQVRLDLPVRLTWLERDGVVWPAFEPADPAGPTTGGPAEHGPTAGGLTKDEG